MAWFAGGVSAAQLRPTERRRAVVLIMVVLGENPLYRMGRFDPGDLFVQSPVGIDEAVVVDAQLMKNGGIEVADMDRVLGHAPAVVIGLPVGDASLDPAAGHPDGEGPSVMIPSRAAAVEAALLIDRASEFTPQMTRVSSSSPRFSRSRMRAADG